MADDTHTFVIVSKSGKTAETPMDIYKDFVIVKSFDTKAWSCQYYSTEATVIPTSDTPLYFTTFNAHSKLDWKCRPTYLLHGHAFATEEEAEKLGFPISSKETLYSTPEDAQELFDLMRKHPFPEDQVYIRKGHGFILIGTSPEHAWRVFKQKMEPILVN